MLNQYLETLKKEILDHIHGKFEGSESKVSLDSINLENPPNPDLGDFAFPCFPLVKSLKNAPNKISEMLSKDFKESENIEGIEASGPYLNIKVKKEKFNKVIFHDILTNGENFGRANLGENKKLMIEYSAPNTNKPLHIGHVRNNLTGMALANILEFAGYKVIRANLINDRGIHICKSMLAYQKWGGNKTPESTGLKGDHFVGLYYVKFDEEIKKEKKEYTKAKNVDTGLFSKENIKSIREKAKKEKNKEEKKKIKQQASTLQKQADEFEQNFLKDSTLYNEALVMLKKWEENDKEVRALWRKMNDWVLKGFDETYELLGCKFDKLYFESETYKLGKDYVNKGLEKGIFYKKEDGTVWVSAENLKKVAKKEFKGIELKDKLLLRADGTSVYMTQDIGTAILKQKDFELDSSIYVVAEEQRLHFKTLFAILKLLEVPSADGCEHVSYGMVVLPEGMGKIKSREGTAVDADLLVEEMAKRAEEVIREGDIKVPEEAIKETSVKIALAALKIFMLQVSLDKVIQFDPKKTISFQGDTGPAILYSYTRIKSILRKCDKDITENIKYDLLNSKEEAAIINHIQQYPKIIEAAARTRNISLVTNYLLKLTKLYASFYSACRVLQAETEELKKARLLLCKVTAQVLKNGLKLLGVEEIERM